MIVLALVCTTSASAVFWREDLRYSLPTPRPANLVEAKVGATMPLRQWLGGARLTRARGPVLLHFFNPACSCSRFNLTHLRELRARFHHRVTFVAVVQTDEDERTTRTRVEGYELDMPYVLDMNGRIAAQAGIYSTPQALLLDEDARVLYHGNYNVSRYCTDPRTEFVRMAIESALATAPVSLPPTPAYGCELPSTTRGADGARLLTASP